MNKVTLTFESPLSKEEIQKLLLDDANHVLDGHKSKAKNILPYMVKISSSLKSKVDTLKVETI